MSVRDQLVDAARAFYARGWMEGTAGNLSAREGEGFWVTASGATKGKLTPEDFVLVDAAGTVIQAPPGRKPSARTSIHAVVYASVPSASHCYHVHPLAAVKASFRRREVTLPPLEMLKGFGLPDEPVRVPVFPNHADVTRIAAALSQRISDLPLPLLLIDGHGLTTWADSDQRCRNQLELLDFLFRFLVETGWDGSTS